MNIPRLAPHDLRRSCARLCHDTSGELEQIQVLLGHVSVQTTERYIGCKQHLRIAVNDRLASNPAEFHNWTRSGLLSQVHAVEDWTTL